jgi:hypothetical protein
MNKSACQVIRGYLESEFPNCEVTELPLSAGYVVSAFDLRFKVCYEDFQEHPRLLRVSPEVAEETYDLLSDLQRCNVANALRQCPSGKRIALTVDGLAHRLREEPLQPTSA